MRRLVMKTKLSILTPVIVTTVCCLVAVPNKANSGESRRSSSTHGSVSIQVGSNGGYISGSYRPGTTAVRSKPVTTSPCVTTVRPACPGPGYVWKNGYSDCYGRWISGYWLYVRRIVSYRVPSHRHISSRRVTVDAHRRAVSASRNKCTSTRSVGSSSHSRNRSVGSASHNRNRSSGNRR